MAMVSTVYTGIGIVYDINLLNFFHDVACIPLFVLYSHTLYLDFFSSHIFQISVYSHTQLRKVLFFVADISNELNHRLLPGTDNIMYSMHYHHFICMIQIQSRSCTHACDERMKASGPRRFKLLNGVPCELLSHKTRQE